MIVVDIGCATQRDGRLSHAEESVMKLIDRFQPDLLFGFDPEPAMDAGLIVVQTARKQIVIVRSHLAAWTHNGEVAFKFDGLRSAIVHGTDTPASVECFDFSEWLLTLPLEHEQVILKLDCEGAEYPLLRDIHDRHIDRMLSLVLVEWHNGHDPNGWYYGNEWQSEPVELNCPVEAW